MLHAFCKQSRSDCRGIWRVNFNINPLSYFLWSLLLTIHDEKKIILSSACKSASEFFFIRSTTKIYLNLFFVNMFLHDTENIIATTIISIFYTIFFLRYKENNKTTKKQTKRNCFVSSFSLHKQILRRVDAISYYFHDSPHFLFNYKYFQCYFSNTGKLL